MRDLDEVLHLLFALVFATGGLLSYLVGVALFLVEGLGLDLVDDEREPFADTFQQRFLHAKDDVA